VTQPPAQSGMSIIIATHTSAAVLPSLLDSLPAGRKGFKRFETIVVDNDRDDGSVDIALAHATRPRVIRRGGNAGYAAAINAGVVDRLGDSRNSPVGVAVPRKLAKDGSTAGRYAGSPPS